MTRKRAQAGFTLVELTVALVAGLIVALGIVGLSKEATRTFHEEVRISAAEATLRTAVDRLRADLQRAAYMSTANITSDIRIAHAPGATNVASINPAMAGILRLAGIHLLLAGSLTNANSIPRSKDQTPALAPDALEIGGNLTSTEEFEIQSIQNSGNCARLLLSSNSPSMYRINAGVNAGDAAAPELNNIFQPFAGAQFIVRISDDTGRSQFLPTCPDGATGIQGGQPFVAVDITPPGAILTPQLTGGLGGVSPTTGGQAHVNPVQIVRWEIINVSKEPAQYQALGGQSLPGTLDPDKYDLVRSYVDAQGNRINGSMEVIAEYAVDLAFAFSVENGAPNNPAIAPAMLSFAFDDTTNANQNWADDVSQVPATRPQRIRLVRARVATRAAQPDRSLSIAVNTPTGMPSQNYLYRYCLVKPCDKADDTPRWARMRTLTTEVAIPNQSQVYW
jgi:prepilin-type N-terminal cleavage/methylation domain-containing protein